MMDRDRPTATRQRVRIVGGPWPERIGCEGVICTPPVSGCYPHASAGHVVVLLDDDPITSKPFLGVEPDPSWSCVMRERDVEYVSVGGKP